MLVSASPTALALAPGPSTAGSGIALWFPGTFGTPAHLVLVLVVGAIAGAINTAAGGGSILTFPTLLWLGMPPVLANTTNNVGIWPGNISGTWGMRREMRLVRRGWFWLLAPALVGGWLGAWLLLHTPSRTFAGLAPWLILLATVIFALEPALRRLQDRSRARQEPPGAARVTPQHPPAIVFLVQFVVSIYGGYFGAGMGIVFLTALALCGSEDLHANIALKNLLALVINGIAVVAFVLAKMVSWPVAGLLAIGTVLGGYGGAVLVRWAGRETTRKAVVIFGVLVTVALLVHWRLPG